MRITAIMSIKFYVKNQLKSQLKSQLCQLKAILKKYVLRIRLKVVRV